MTDKIDIHDAAKDAPLLKQLTAVERDVLLATVNINQRGNPTEAVHFDEVTETMSRFYDRRNIIPESVESVMLDLDEYGYLECVGTGAFKPTTDALEAGDALLMELWALWATVKPWEDGTKVVVDRQQVGVDATEAVDEYA